VRFAPTEKSPVKLPLLSLALAALAGLMMALPVPVQEVLYVDHDMVARREFWGLLSGHWLHSDVQHLLWNLLGLLVLGTLIENHSRRLLLVSLLMGTAAVDLLLLSPMSELQRYCGLSGVLNTLLGVALYLQWRQTHSNWVTLSAALCVLKIFVEMTSGQSLFTQTNWPSFPAAHLAGFIGAGIVIWLLFMEKTHPKVGVS
jgi:rhomboid family GlyGly-CTERM serine protease